MTTDPSQFIATYANPIGKPVKALTDAEVTAWIRILEADVAAGLTPYTMKDRVVADAVAAGIAQKLSPEEIVWRRTNPDRLWLTELLDLHRLRHCQPNLREKIVRWD